MLILALVSILAAGDAPGRDVYKCNDGGAAPVYQDRPCGPGTTSRTLDADASGVSVIPFVLPPEPPATKPIRAPRPAGTAPRSDKRRAVDRPRSDYDIGERRHLKDGMTDAEVFARLGPPDFQAGKTGRKMRWTYLPAPGDAQTVTLVKFEDGKVVGVERSILR